MPYQFPPDLDERVKAEMFRRGLQSEDDVLREALDALNQLDQDKLRRWQEGNEIAIEQSRRGLSKPLDLESVLARVEERLAKHPQSM
jgi:Arc/MetJ-type ribon-helix-helix transcriptional regulator